MERMTTRTGWWAEREDDEEINPFAPEAPWVATLQTDTGCCSLAGIAFYTEGDCLTFIRTCVVGQPLLD
jgi:hypothetical protein